MNINAIQLLNEEDLLFIVDLISNYIVPEIFNEAQKNDV